MDDHGALAGLLRAHRESAGLTQQQLATQAGISLGALQDVEQGRTARPRGRSLDRLAMVLRLTPDQHEELLRASVGAVGAAHDGGQGGIEPGWAGAGPAADGT